jgi:hypothetical protein
MLDGGKPLAERLKNLPQRRFVVNSGSERWKEAVVPTIEEPRTSYSDLLNRSRALRALPRPGIEQQIAARHAAFARSTDEVLDGWE